MFNDGLAKLAWTSSRRKRGVQYAYNFLPFLYRTGTILRPYATESAEQLPEREHAVLRRVAAREHLEHEPKSSLARHVQRFHGSEQIASLNGEVFQDRNGDHEGHASTTTRSELSTSRRTTSVRQNHLSLDHDGQKQRDGLSPKERTYPSPSKRLRLPKFDKASSRGARYSNDEDRPRTGVRRGSTIQDGRSSTVPSSLESGLAHKHIFTSQEGTPDSSKSTITPAERKVFESLLLTKIRRVQDSPESGQTTQVVAMREDPATELITERQADSLDTLLDQLTLSPRQTEPTILSILSGISFRARDRPKAEYRRHQDRNKATRDSSRWQRWSSKESELFQLETLDAEVEAAEAQLQLASTDVEVWNIFREKVIDQLVALDLGQEHTGSIKDNGQESARNRCADSKSEGDQPPQVVLETSDGDIELSTASRQPQDEDNFNVTPAEQKLEKPDAKSSIPHSAQPQENQKNVDMGALARVLGKTTLRVQQHLMNGFPASPLALSVVPTICALGPAPAAFVLSTQHYDQHMIASWKTYKDPVALIATLREMDENVLSFSGMTATTIKKALNFSRDASRGVHGVNVQALWKMDAKLSAIQQLYAWRDYVEQTRHEEALRNSEYQQAKAEVLSEIGKSPVRFVGTERRKKVVLPNDEDDDPF